MIATALRSARRRPARRRRGAAVDLLHHDVGVGSEHEEVEDGGYELVPRARCEGSRLEAVVAEVAGIVEGRCNRQR